MKLPKHLFVKVGEEITEVAYDKAVAAFAKENGLKKAEAEEFIKDVLKGEADYDYTDVAPADAKAHKASAKAAAKLVEDSEKNKKALHEAILEKEEAEKKKGELIVKSAEKGASEIAKIEGGITETLQKAVGSDFVVDEYGLSLAKGVAISPESISRAIGGINNGAEVFSKARTAYLIKLGDAVNIARKEWGEEEGDNIVAQAIPVEGQGKHNVLQSASVMGYIDSLYENHKDRPISLTFTHLQEAKNYGRNKDGSNAIAPAKVKKIIATAVEEKLSCADLRDLLKKARPAVEPTPGENGDGEGEGGEGEGESPTAKGVKELFGYLYLHYATSVVTFTEELREDLLKEVEDDKTPAYKVMDLASRVVLKANGKKESEIADHAEAEA